MGADLGEHRWFSAVGGFLFLGRGQPDLAVKAAVVPPRPADDIQPNGIPLLASP